jgi:DNA-directed RNA polymerase specialized sigma24 family protein
MLDVAPERWRVPDTDLVARMAAKDEAALNELLARHERTAYAVAIGFARDPARAERAVSEAFRDAFWQAERYVPGEITVLAWIMSLTRRRAQSVAATAT